METNKKPVILPTDAPIDYDFERKMKEFTSYVKRNGIIEEIRRRRYYIKKSELKRLAAKLRGKYAR